MSEHQARPELPEVITVAEQAQAAGRKTGDILPPGAHPDLDALRDHIRGFLPDGTSQAAMMAKSKAEELLFWLRAARNRSGLV
jgi:hypothetical protein